MRTQSEKDECYFDRNQIIQLLALSWVELGKKAFYSTDPETEGYLVLCLEIDDKTQLSWHIPKNEIVKDLPIEENKWIPIDVSDRKRIIYEILEKSF